MLSSSNLVGGTLCTATATPSKDGSELYVASSRDVRTYSCVTGDRLALLAGHTAEVTAICRDPDNDATVLTASADGSIRRWQTAEQICLKTVQNKEPIMGMVLAGKGIAVVSTSWRGGEAGRLARCNIETEAWQPMLRLNTPGTTLAMSPSQDFVATFEKNTVHCIKPHHPDLLKFKMHHTRNITVWDTDYLVFRTLHQLIAQSKHHRDSWTGTCTRSEAHLQSAIQCVAFDSTNKHIAAGDVSGRIIIWTGLEAAAASAENGTLPQDGNAGMSIATIHWHAHPVAALCFSQDGRYLLSGGEEAVLVVWQLLTLKRTYLPRLGGPISHIACVPDDPTKYIVGQKNNVIRVVSLAAMQVECSVYGVRPAPAAESYQEVNKGISLQPGSGYAVLPSSGAQLQFYDLARDCHVAKLQVFPRNVIAQAAARDSTWVHAGKLVVEPTVVHSVFTADASTLVTVESHPAISECRSGQWHALKFWDVENAGSSKTVYTVNSVVNDPHFGHITSVCCHPQDSIIVTTSVHPDTGKGELRIWAKHHFKRVPGAKPGSRTWHWHCQSAGTHKGDSMHSAVFSSDGSLVAVGTSVGVALIDPDTCVCSAFLASPFPRKDKKHVHFAHTCFLPGSAFLAAAQVSGDSGGVCVWNLLTLTPWWIAEGQVRDICAHPSKPWLAAVIGAKDRAWGVMEVDINSGKVQSWWEQTEGKLARVLYAPCHSALCSKLGRKSVLLVISEERQVMLLTEQQHESKEAAGRHVADIKGKTSLRDMFGGIEAVDVDVHSKTFSSDAPASRQAVDLPMLSTDSHLLPSPAELCSRMLESFLMSST